MSDKMLDRVLLEADIKAGFNFSIEGTSVKEKGKETGAGKGRPSHHNASLTL